MIEKPPKEIRLSVWVMGVTTIILGLAIARELITKPVVITNRETIILPNDSVKSMNEKILQLKGELAEKTTVADVRAQIIHDLTGPLQKITDTQIYLARLSVTEAKEIHKDLVAYHVVQADRQTELMNRIDALDLKPAINTFLEKIEVRYDTIYAAPAAPLPHRGSWWKRRIAPLFTGKK